MTSPMHSPLQSQLQPVMRSPMEFRRRGGGAAPFDPLSTPMSAFYDRTALSSLLQTSAGDPPVTAAAQPIGLGLDLSRPQVDTPMALTTWTNLGCDVFSASGSSVTVSRTSTSGAQYALFGPTFTGITGTWYRAKVIVSGFEYFGSSDTQVNFGAGSNGRSTSFTISADGEYEVYLKCTTGTSGTSFRIVLAAPTGGYTSALTLEVVELGIVTAHNQVQETAGKRPLTAGTPIYADFDPVDDELVTTFPASLGSGCVVARSLPGTGASITTGVTIGTTFTDNVDAHTLQIFTAAQWAALSAGQISQLTNWLNKKAGL